MDPNLDRKLFVVTGGTSGIGKQMALELLRGGGEVVIASHNPEKGRAVESELRTAVAGARCEFRPIDLGDQASVRTFAKQLLADHPRIDVLINNAGIQLSRRTVGKDGREKVLATNVLGPFLLTNLLLPALKAAAPARIVNTASTYAGGLELEDLQFEHRKYSSVASYKQSKQANRMWTWALARRLHDSGVTANAFAPGFVKTALYRDTPARTRAVLFFVAKLFGRSVEEGAATGVWLSSDPSLAQTTGRFFEQKQEKPCEFRNEAAEERLWSMCEAMTRANA